MDSLKGTLSAMSELFNSRMAEFQQELQKSSTSTTAPSTSTLASEFASFKKFIASALETVQRQVEFLGREIDRLEMKRRRKMLLLHGVPEEQSENVEAVVIAAINKKLNVAECTPSSISRCQRLGRPTDKKTRPVLVKFREVPVRDKVWFAKTKFKGSGFTLSEFLTKTRHSVFMQARQRFGVSKCWTRGGQIYILAPDGSHHQVDSLADLDAIAGATGAAPSVSSVDPATQASNNITHRPRRMHK